VRQGLANRQEAIRLGRPFIAPCAIRGTAPLVHKRWRNGHLRIGNDRLAWWRHFSRRRSPVELDPRRLRVTGYRRVRTFEAMVVSPRSTIVSCDDESGDQVEFAFMHDVDLAGFLRATNSPGPASEPAVEHR